MKGRAGAYYVVASETGKATPKLLLCADPHTAVHGTENMKSGRLLLPRIALVVLAITCLATASLFGAFLQVERESPSVRPTGAATVFVTRTGEKYHRETCRHLSKSKTAISLKDAAERYGPCSVCKPPVLARPEPSADNPQKATAAGERKSPTPSTPATAGQCQATTKKGTQCSRRAQPGRAYCWQH